MALGKKHLLLLQGTRFSSQHSHRTLLLSQDLTPLLASACPRHTLQCTDMHVGKTLICIKIFFKKCSHSLSQSKQTTLYLMVPDGGW